MLDVLYGSIPIVKDLRKLTEICGLLLSNISLFTLYHSLAYVARNSLVVKIGIYPLVSAATTDTPHLAALTHPCVTLAKSLLMLFSLLLSLSTMFPFFGSCFASWTSNNMLVVGAQWQIPIFSCQGSSEHTGGVGWLVYESTVVGVGVQWPRNNVSSNTAVHPRKTMPRLRRPKFLYVQQSLKASGDSMSAIHHLRVAMTCICQQQTDARVVTAYIWSSTLVQLGPAVLIFLKHSKA